MIKKITARHHFFNHDDLTFTGKEYVVDYCTIEKKVKKIHSIKAYKRDQPKLKIDITMFEVMKDDVDHRIDKLFPWDELASDSDNFWNEARDIVTTHARLMREYKRPRGDDSWLLD